MSEETPAESAPGPTESAAPGASASEPGERAGEFERYALLAALTLVVLCLLVWERWHDGAKSEPTPRPDRTLRVEIGGDDPKSPPPPGGPPRIETNRVSHDAPLVPKSAPPPPQRTYVVRSGDTLGEIARAELGSANRAQEIAALNELADAAKIRAGQVLKLPAK